MRRSSDGSNAFLPQASPPWTFARNELHGQTPAPNQKPSGLRDRTGLEIHNVGCEDCSCEAKLNARNSSKRAQAFV